MSETAEPWEPAVPDELYWKHEMLDDPDPDEHDADSEDE
jgi:hypothetical protein